MPTSKDFTYTSALSDLYLSGNRMISSAIWDKSAQVNFLKTNKIARARKVSAICGLWKIYECWFIPNCPRKIMWHDYLLIMYLQKFDLLFLFYVSTFVTAPCSRLQMTTSLPRRRLVKILTGEYWWIKTNQLEICFSKTRALFHFTFLTFHVFPLPSRKEIQLLARLLFI